MSKWVKTIFIISIALNFAVIGVVAGRMLGFGHGRHHGMHHHILKLIPSEKRPEVEKILTAHKQAYPHRKGRMISNWDRFEDLLGQETFDRAVFLATFNDEMKGHNARWIAGGKTIADIADLLTATERKNILSKMKQKMSRRRHHKHRH